MFFRLAAAVAVAFVLVASARADDFLSDLAGCVKAPITAAKFAATDAKKAAEFVVNHGECVPLVVSVDPLLIGMTGGFIPLQANGSLPSGYSACVDATLGTASQQIAKVLKAYVNTPPLASLMPAAGKTKLVQIAEGQVQDGLYSVPGIALVAERLDCACAVTASGVNIDTLKERVKEVIDTAGSCKAVLGKLAGAAYGAAKDTYKAGKDAVNAAGCALGLGGCSDGPPLFCEGYINARDQGVSYAEWAAILNQFFAKEVQQCEQEYTGVLAARVRQAQAAADKKLFDQEMAKAQQLGAANALGFAFRWSKKCLDDKCKAAIAKFADLYTADVQDPETLQYYKTFAVALAAMEKKYGSLAEVALALSKNRVMANAGAPVELRMQAFDCHAFLGRARQSLCPAAKAFKVCVAYVNEGKWDLCALAGNPGLYSAGEALNRQLRNSGCIPYIARGVSSGPFSFSSAMTAQCLAARARAACDVFRKGKSAVVCQGPQEIASFDARRYRGRPPLLQPVPGLRPVPVEPAPPPGRMPGEERMPAAPQPMTRAVAPQPSLLPPPATPQVQKSTLCRFTSGPRRGETQDYAPMAPIPVGSSCQDARGSFGTVVAR